MCSKLCMWIICYDYYYYENTQIIAISVLCFCWIHLNVARLQKSIKFPILLVNLHGNGKVHVINFTQSHHFTYITTRVCRGFQLIVWRMDMYSLCRSSTSKNIMWPVGIRVENREKQLLYGVERQHLCFFPITSLYRLVCGNVTGGRIIKSNKHMWLCMCICAQNYMSIAMIWYPKSKNIHTYHFAHPHQHGR
jgi:hypothetical protein